MVNSYCPQPLSSGVVPPPAGWTVPGHNCQTPPPYLGCVEEGLDGVGNKHFFFDDKSVRAAFIQKVFCLVSVMLLLVAAMVAIPLVHDGSRLYIVSTPSLYYLGAAIFFPIYLILLCCESVRRSFPINLILTFGFTLAAGLMTMNMAARIRTEVVFMALIMTILTCGGVIIYAKQAKHDFTKFSGILCVLSWILFAFGIVAIIAVKFFNVHILYTCYSFLACLCFMAYLVIDVQMLMGGKRFEVSPEDYIFISLQLFVDILYIFWHLLNLFATAAGRV